MFFFFCLLAHKLGQAGFWVRPARDCTQRLVWTWWTPEGTRRAQNSAKKQSRRGEKEPNPRSRRPASPTRTPPKFPALLASPRSRRRRRPRRHRWRRRPRQNQLAAFAHYPPSSNPTGPAEGEEKAKAGDKSTGPTSPPDRAHLPPPMLRRRPWRRRCSRTCRPCGRSPPS
jgi:hypothetical protein